MDKYYRIPKSCFYRDFCCVCGTAIRIIKTDIGKNNECEKCGYKAVGWRRGIIREEYEDMMKGLYGDLE